MKRFILLAIVPAIFGLSACGAPADENSYYDSDTPSYTPPPEPEYAPQNLRLRVKTYGGGNNSEVTKVVVDGTQCIIFTTYEGGSAMSCDWSNNE